MLPLPFTLWQLAVLLDFNANDPAFFSKIESELIEPEDIADTRFVFGLSDIDPMLYDYFS